MTALVHPPLRRLHRDRRLRDLRDLKDRHADVLHGHPALHRLLPGVDDHEKDACLLESQYEEGHCHPRFVRWFPRQDPRYHRLSI